MAEARACEEVIAGQGEEGAARAQRQRASGGRVGGRGPVGASSPQDHDDVGGRRPARRCIDRGPRIGHGLRGRLAGPLLPSVSFFFSGASSSSSLASASAQSFRMT